MLVVNKFTSEQFTSNVYAITSSLSNDEVILIDCGEFNAVIDFLSPSANINGIFITHYHYDHIYYIQKFMDKFPNLKFYGSLVTLEGLANVKQNLSFYHDDPIEIKGINFEVLLDGQCLPVLENTVLRVMETDGHCEGSLTYLVDNFIFTGDALIPNIPIVTKLRTGNKQKAKASVRKIKQMANPQNVICPGHLETIESIDVDWNLYLNDEY